MRLLVVTSQFPIQGEPTRGRPIVQTIQQLTQLATVRVVSPIAVYPRWAQPGSYVAHAPGAPAGLDCEVAYPSYPALPGLSRPFNGRLCAGAIGDALARFRPDVVLSYWLYPDAYGAMLAAGRAGVPLVAGARGSDIRVRDAISRHLTRRVVRNARRLLVVSEDLGRLAVKRYGAEAERVKVIANGCDAATFHLSDKAAAREALGVAPDAELVLYVGRLVPEKGLRELLTAMRGLTATRPRLQLVLVGGGPMQTELDGLSAGAGNVRFTGPLGPEAVAKWMVAASVVTLPSYSEGHPNVLVEAMACGRPVVATDVGGIPEVVDAASGVLIQARDSADLARGLEFALQRDWDETALSARFSRSWHQVAEETLLQCAQAADEPSARASWRQEQPA
ncbi:Glycosyltransferase involved in cell wall bisynthesis [Pseudoxanthomonas sp. GM95]|uniref:glycosyltransferase n=1 Tax=Pseudoxanthomonas sp. GM95 TaxID=1881043 RepID=UPI0008BB6E3C|nr:glycosyltransferase [Pseudoxanthomonas sp. GM95]SEL09233.1 Glycosyltransferase involved in cell wall bisynthesis [Pseudoxanthomonas sp. GM95]